MSKPISIQSNYLWLMTLTYTLILIFANWFGARLIDVYGLTFDGGTLIFPLTFVLSDLITEVYGYKYARRTIWCGFIFNIIFVLYGQMIAHLPDPDFATHNKAFNTLLTIDTRIIIASALSYLCAEPINSLILAKLKIKTRGRFVGLRFVLSTVAASGIDSFIFSFLAFYATMTNQQLLAFILAMWASKVAIEVMMLPVSLKLAKTLKEKEQIDIYDSNTNFNLFSIDTAYTEQANAFGK